MSISFVFGPAGSGKSTYVQEKLIKESMEHPKDNFLLIVPDQFTMQTQMDIVKKHPNKGILNIDVLSFNRLCYRVFSVAGKNSVPVLDDTGKSLVLRKVASKVADKMPFMGRYLNKQGYIHEIKSSISEFMQYGLSVKDVQKLCNSVGNPLLKSKLNDLAVIYEAFNDYNKGKFITSEETLDMLCDKLAAADFITGSTVVFDGFTGFTPIQEKVVLRLSELAKKVIITFNLSAPESPCEIGGEEKLFYLSRKGAARLKTKAKELGIAVDNDELIDSSENARFKNNKAFAHIEKNLFRYPVNKYTDDISNIEIFSCKDLESEVSKICLKIYDLVRSGKYAYRDIAVVTGNLEKYGVLFESRMRELGMPVFIDRTSAIVLNPFIEYIKSALQVIIKDYSYDSVFHYLRSGFTDFDEEETDRFERYVTSLNIRGKSAYSKSFSKRERGLKDKTLAENEISLHESVRQRLKESFSVLEEESKTAGDYVRNLYTFIVNNNSYEKLEQYENFFNENNNLSKAVEYGQIYKNVMELLDTIDSLIGDEEMALDEFYRIFEAGIAELEVGIIPKNIDRIVVGDIERTRMSEIKALFFAGVNDGNIPKSNDKGGILNGMEREMMSSFGYDLAPTPREEMFTQRLYLYMLLCKPTHRLCLSYAQTDSDGKAMKPSYLIKIMTDMFEKLSVCNMNEEVSVADFISMKDCSHHYAFLLRKYVEGTIDSESMKLLAALDCLYKNDNFSDREIIIDSAFKEYFATPLSKEIVRMLYGNIINSSISRMELYAGCAYAHFLKYGIKLSENAEYAFEARDLGTIYHGVLDNFSTMLERNGLTWATFSKEQGERLVREAVESFCEDYEQGMLKEDEQSAYTISKITAIMLKTVETLQFHVLKGKFAPLKHEYSFERTLDLESGDKMHLNGKIDRIDLCENEGKIYVKILDYKSGQKDIDVTNIYHGIEQQLALYMAEAVYSERVKHPEKQIIPSAMLYYTLDNPFVEATSDMPDEARELLIKKALKVKGVFESSAENLSFLDENVMGDSEVLPISFKKDGEPSAQCAKHLLSNEEMEGMLKYVEGMVKNIGTGIFEGNKKISPFKSDKHDACMYCDYKSICRFDGKIPGYAKRNGKEIEKEAARKIVLGGDTDAVYTF